MTYLLVGPHFHNETIALEGGGVVDIRCGLNVPKPSPEGDGFRGWLVEVREITIDGRPGPIAYRGASWIIAVITIRDLVHATGHGIAWSTLEDAGAALAAWRDEALRSLGSVPIISLVGTETGCLGGAV